MAWGHNRNRIATRLAEVLRRTGCGLVAFAYALPGGAAWGAICDRPQDALAIRTAAVQQEMMVAAFKCQDVDSYNRFVISHQVELQDSDKVLMDFFQQQNTQTGFDDYNLFKTELANVSSLRSVRDPLFCRRVDANFAVALGRNGSLEQLMSELPYPVATGSVRCPQYFIAATTPVETAAPLARVRHRTWLGRLVDSIAAIFD